MIRFVVALLVFAWASVARADGDIDVAKILGQRSDDAIQLALPFDGASSHAIDTTVDSLRDRFGSSAVTRGVLLGRREGLQVPLLPD